MADDLVSVLKAELDEIKRRLAVLERPDATQKLMLPARLSEAQAAITKEVADRQWKDTQTDAAITAEIEARKQTDANLATEVQNRTIKDSQTDAAILAEIDYRKAGDAGLSDRINTEANTRWEQDQKAFDAAATAQRSADNAGAYAQQVADWSYGNDQDLQGQINNHESRIEQLEQKVNQSSGSLGGLPSLDPPPTRPSA